MFDPNIEVDKQAITIDKVRGLPRNLWLFRYELNEQNNTGARLLG